jgi:hypothetical protein
MTRDGPPEALINGDVGVVALSEHPASTATSAAASSLPVLECFMHPPVFEKSVPTVTFKSLVAKNLLHTSALATPA